MSRNNTLFMETTKISSDTSASAITKCLVAAGARSINTDYDNDSRIVGITWLMHVDGSQVVFRMPVKVKHIQTVLLKEVQATRRWTDESKRGIIREEVRDKAERIAWRQLFRWVEAQMAMIDTGMAEMSEVFFPYVEAAPGRTIYQLARESRFKMLAAPQPTAP